MEALVLPPPGGYPWDLRADDFEHGRLARLMDCRCYRTALLERRASLNQINRLRAFTNASEDKPFSILFCFARVVNASEQLFRGR